MKKLIIDGLDLIEICNNYLREVVTLTERLKEIFGVSDFWDLRNTFFPKGHVKKDGFGLTFHGRGVRITENDKDLFDIEYGMNIHICGLEEYRILKYIKSKNSEIQLEISDLMNEFQKLSKVGRFKKIYDLYFINSPEYRDKLKKYKHNNR